MAEYYLVLALTFSLLIHSISSRTYSASSTTVLFDVADSIDKTLEILSMEPKESKTEIKTKTETTSSFSISLHARSSLVKHHHKDYQSLTLSRLERDSARVKSLTTRLNLAINEFNLSSFKPAETAVILPEDISTPITSGVPQGTGEYFARIGVGQPAKPYYMEIDTGSDVTWLQCQPCSNCYQQSDPIFDPSSSSTYSPLSCNSQQCSLLHVSACSRADRCLYKVSYGDGSVTVGEFATETVSFGNSGSVSNVAIGCGQDNKGLFVGSAGLLGLGRGSLSLPSQIQANSFSYCLVNRDSSSSSTLDFNSGLPPDSVTAPLLRNSKMDTFMYVALSGISVGGRLLSIPPSIFVVDESGRGGVIVDSGTTISQLQPDAYTSLRDAFVAGARDLPSTTGFGRFDTCFDLSTMKSVAVPTIEFHFTGGKTLPLPPSNYLIPVSSAGKFCLAFAPSQFPLSIIGNVQQQGIRVSFDFADSVVGFLPDNC